MATDTGYKFSTSVYIVLENYQDVYGQITPVPTSRILTGETYGQITPISGIDFQPGSVPVSTVSGAGDILYYGNEARLIMSSGSLGFSYGTRVEMSGFAGSFISTSSPGPENSLACISGAGTIQLPTPVGYKGVYFDFVNPLGATMVVSGVGNTSITTSSGTTNTVTLSSVGSHLGIISDGARWIAVEENEITA